MGHIDCDIKIANNLVRRVFVYRPQIKTTQRHIACREQRRTVKSHILHWFVCRLTLRTKRSNAVTFTGKYKLF